MGKMSEERSEKYSTKDLTKTILIIAGIGLLIPTLAVAPGLALALKPFIKNHEGDHWKKHPPSRIKNTLERLQNQKLISIKETDGKTRIELLEKGQKKVLSYKIEELKLEKKKWDGWWRIVIFDIPEKNRAARDFLRYKLKDLGFYLLQKSVLVTPWECQDVVDFVKHFYGVGDCVNLILAKNFEGEEKIKEYFKL